jgi:Tfp pilus assembly protein PilO
MAVSSKQSFFGFLGGLILVLVAVALMMYWANSQLESRSASIQQKQAESQELDDKTARAGQLKDELKEYGDLISVTSDIVPNTKTQENIVGELIDIAAGRGLKLENISFGGSADVANPETSQTEKVDGMPGVFSLTVSTSIETDYENVLQFLEDLETNKRQFEVTNLSISPTDEIFSVSLSIVTYIKP